MGIPKYILLCVRSTVWMCSPREGAAGQGAPPSDPRRWQAAGREPLISASNGHWCHPLVRRYL